jgi:hypothetical protein
MYLISVQIWKHKLFALIEYRFLRTLQKVINMNVHETMDQDSLKHYSPRDQAEPRLHNDCITLYET